MKPVGAEQPMAASQPCPQCGGPLPTGALAGLCPACLLKQGAAADTAPAPGAAPFAPPTVAELAKLFPQLEILGLIGQGGMGAVYKARQPTLDRFVALKVLPPQAAPGVNFAERFNREARALAKLSHPNIVAVYDFGQAGALHYFIMEFVDGANLRQLIRTGRLAPREALAVVPQICDALQFAHDEGIVHRDIKPENILVDRRGRVKITDFGIAKILGIETGASRLTREGQVMGTPHYMAPEQVERPQTVDHRADIYSLGVVFYEMLTGELPLGKFPAPSQKVQVDVRLDEVVLHALEKEPERRYQQASQVKTAVETIATTAPPEGGTPMVGAPASAWSFPLFVERDGQRYLCWPGVLLLCGTVGLVVMGANLAIALVLWLLHAPVRLTFTAGELMLVLILLAACALMRLTAFKLAAHEASHASAPPTAKPGTAMVFIWTVVLVILSAAVAGGMAFFISWMPGVLARASADGDWMGHISRITRVGVSIGLLALGGLFFIHSIVRAAFRQRPPPPPVAPPQGETATIGVPASAGFDIVLRQVKAPAIGLVATAILNWLAIPAIVMAMVFVGAGPNSLLGDGLVVVPIAAFVLCTVMLVGALKMMRLESRTWAVAASMLAIFIAPGNIIGLPLGIWALVVLARPEVRVAFRQQRSARGEPPAAAGAPTQNLPTPTELERARWIIFVRAVIMCIAAATFAIHLSAAIGIPTVIWGLVGVWFVAAKTLAGRRTTEEDRLAVRLAGQVGLVHAMGVLAVGLVLALSNTGLSEAWNLFFAALFGFGIVVCGLRLAGWRRVADWFARRWRTILLRDVPVAVVIALLLRMFVIETYRVKGDTVSPEVPRGSLVFVYKLARTFEPGDVVVYWHNREALTGRVAEAGPREGVVRVQRRKESPEPVAAADIIGKVIFNTRPTPQGGAVSNRPSASTQNDVGGSKPPLLGADLMQDVTKNIQPDGTIRFKTAITQRNTTGEPLKTLRFYNSGFIRVDKLSDTQGRTIPFSLSRTGKMTLRYDAPLAEPVKPGAEFSYVMEGTETGLVKRLPQSDAFEYTTRHWPGNIRTRRIELHRLPVGAQLLSKTPADLIKRTRDGRIELFIDRLIPAGDSLEISYQWVKQGK